MNQVGMLVQRSVHDSPADDAEVVGKAALNS